MVGREVSALYPDQVRKLGPARLSVRGLRRTAESPAVNFDAQAGEILGIGGLLGSGRSELLLSIFGSEPIFEGEIKIDGETVKPTGPRSMMNSGVALNRPLARSNPFGGSRIR
jgi:ABC-type sugar transport system ATPase subunit